MKRSRQMAIRKLQLFPFFAVQLHTDTVAAVSLAASQPGTLHVQFQFDLIRKNARLVLLVVVTRNCVFETMVWMEARVSVVQLPPRSDVFSRKNGVPLR